PLIATGEFARALPWLEQAIQLCETKTVLLALPMAYINAGVALAWLNRPTEALTYLERGVTTSDPGVKAESCLAYLAWAQGLLLGGRLDEAKRTADKALERAVTAGERGTEAGVLRLLAEIASLAVPPALGPAQFSYERALALAEGLGMRPLVADCHLG